MGFSDLLEETDVHAPPGPPITGVSPAIVIDNIDAEGQGRVKVKFPWMPDVEPWARMCAPVAGSGAGFWAIPQLDDEVLVAFANGDITQPYILGGLWSMTSRPPAVLPTDSQTKQVIKTPHGHTVTLEDVPPQITVEHLAGHKLTMTADAVKISVAGDVASIELTVAGDVKITGRNSVDVQGTQVNVAGSALAKVSANGAVELSASGTCKVAGTLVQIN